MAMCFSPGDTCADELLAAIRDNRLVGSAWRAVERALARAQTKSATGGQPLGVTNAWLEFDVGDGRTEPSLFLTPDSPSSVSDYTQHYWPALSGAHPSVAVRAMLGVVDDHDGRLVHLARMLARDDDAVRLCLSNLGPPEMVRLLEDLGQTAVGFECAADHLKLGFDVSRVIAKAYFGFVLTSQHVS